MVEVKFNDLNGSKSLRRFADLSSCVSPHLSQMDGVVIYIFMDVPLDFCWRGENDDERRWWG
jgi:hypothetical protein